MRARQHEHTHNLYLKAYSKTLDSYTQDKELKPYIKKLIIYGVKAINSKPERKCLAREELEQEFAFIDLLRTMMSILTPKEFMSLFPIAKEYDGHKYGMKDYFYTMDYIKSLKLNEPIGTEILEFLWAYHNWEIARFTVNSLGCLSDLRKTEGQPSLMEEWAAKNNVKTYTLHTDSQGKKFLLDNETGRTAKVSRPRPKYLKVIK